MNIINKEILNSIYKYGHKSQRSLSGYSGYALGTVNNSIKELVKEGYIDNDINLLPEGLRFIESHQTKNAIILAAGYGMRMVPINTEMPKGLIEIHGEVLIERTIRQLHEAGIENIYIVVGYMKEHYAYLIDEFNVKLLVNTNYREKNNLYSLKMAKDHLSDTYIIPCDIWCGENPYSSHEMFSWYMISDAHSPYSPLYINRKRELKNNGTNGNVHIGIAYISHEDTPTLTENIENLCSQYRYDSAFWESAFLDAGNITVAAKVVPAENVVEINTYEQLRELDDSSAALKADSIDVICKVLDADPTDIRNISSLKKGMTNRSFIFFCKDKQYIMRIPGEGTNKLINRNNEANVYRSILEKGICDNVLYINPDNGYKLTEYMENTRNCDPLDPSDTEKAMALLRKFHEMKIRVDHEFNIYDQIDYYESLRNTSESIYRDYKETKDNILRLKPFIEENSSSKSLTHIDAVCDNFLFSKNQEGVEEVHMIDWEYAGMADPHIDLAMFSIYSFYEKDQIDELIRYYFPEGTDRLTIIKIYAYAAVCGLLWSNWCEYKLSLGVEFGEYSLRQYRYAREFFRIAKDELLKEGIII